MITRRQAQSAILSGRTVYNRHGEPGTMIEFTRQGYRWMRHGHGDTWTFPGHEKCIHLSLTNEPEPSEPACPFAHAKHESHRYSWYGHNYTHDVHPSSIGRMCSGDKRY